MFTLARDRICQALYAGQCEWPWEFPAYGRFGCESDCGRDLNTTNIAVNIKANFVGHPSISPRVLMSSVRWNLCLNDQERTARGEADLCWCASTLHRLCHLLACFVTLLHAST